jgi:hypothetical protein
MNQNGRGERNQNVSNDNTRLGSNYDRYNPNVLQEFNNLNFGRNSYQNAFSNESNVQFSVSQEPSIEYSVGEYYLKISSADRDVVSYPNGSNFVIELPKEYKNIQSIELIQAIIPDKNNVTSEPYLLLSIEELEKSPLAALDKNTADSFAMLLLTNPPLVAGSFITVDTKIHENTILFYQTPKAKLSRMTIKITDVDGNVFDFGGNGTRTKAYQSTFIFKITQKEKSTSIMNSRNVF